MDEQTVYRLHADATSGRLVLGDLAKLNEALAQIADGIGSITVAGITLVTAPPAACTGLAADVIEGAGAAMRGVEQAQEALLAAIELLRGRGLALTAEIDAARDSGDLP